MAGVVHLSWTPERGPFNNRLGVRYRGEDSLLRSAPA
jgi:hypothetical protein